MTGKIAVAWAVVAGLTGVMMVGTSLIWSPYMALPALFAAVAAGIILNRPFLGLLLIVTLAQVDTIASIISKGLPISLVKILVAITLAGLVVNSYREPRTERIGPREPALKFAVMFGLALFLAALYAEDLGWAGWAIQKLGGMLILFYLVIRLVKEQWQVDILLHVIIASTLFSSLVVIYDYMLGDSLLAASHAATVAEYEGESRSAGASDSDPTTAATMLLAGTTLAMFLALHTPSWRWLNLPTAAAGSVAIMFSFARSSAVAYGIVTIWLILKYRKHRYFPAAVVSVLLISAMSVPFVPAKYWDRLSTMADIDSDISLQRRYTYNVIGLELLAENPLLGVGPRNFRVHYAEEEYRWFPGRTLHPRNLHNMFMSVAVETGLFGFVSFMAILLAAVVGLEDTSRRAESARLRLQAEALQFSFVAYLIASAFTPNEYCKYTWILAGLGIAMTRLAALPDQIVPLLFGKRGT